MEPLGRFQRVLYGVPREYIEGPPRPDPRSKTRGAAGPKGFWPRVWPKMRQRVCLRKILRGALNLHPREQIEDSRNFPREQFHHTAPEAFQQIVILTKSLQ